MNRKSNLLIPLLLSGTAIAQTAGTFTGTGSMNAARSDHNATLLSNGKVLLTGGQVLNGTPIPLVLSSAEVYDPAAGTFAAVGNMLWRGSATPQPCSATAKS